MSHPGAKAHGVCEYFHCKTILGYLAKHLISCDYELHVIRGVIEERIEKINKLQPDFYIEIHLNGFTDQDVYGVESLNFGIHKNSLLCDYINQAIMTGFQSFYKSKFHDEYINRGVKERNDLPILSETTCPAIIVEPLFITHRNSVILLKERGMHEHIAKCIGRGLGLYYSELLLKENQE